MIKDIKAGEKVTANFLVIQANKGATNSSEPYINLLFQDASGVIEAKRWNSTKDDEEVFVPGNIVHVTADCILYKNKEQLKVSSGFVLDMSEVDLYDYLNSAPVPKDKMLSKLTSFMSEIDNSDIRNVVNYIFKENLRNFAIYPAASRNHHEYVSGLLHHTVTMLEVAKAVSSIYPNIDKNYLYAGIMLHDVGKIQELSGPALPKYTTKGKLIGHISIAQALVHEACVKLNVDEEIAMVLEHIILSHHGTKEFGSPVEPSTREAELIHQIDDLDAKMNMFNKFLGEINEGEFTSLIRPLDGRALYKPAPTKKG